MKPSYRVFSSTEVIQLPGSEAERWSQGRKRNIIHIDRNGNNITYCGHW